MMSYVTVGIVLFCVLGLALLAAGGIVLVAVLLPKKGKQVFSTAPQPWESEFREVMDVVAADTKAKYEANHKAELLAKFKATRGEV